MQVKDKLKGKECCKAKPCHTSKTQAWVWNLGFRLIVAGIDESKKTIHKIWKWLGWLSNLL